MEDRHKINVKSNAITAGDITGSRCRHEAWRWSLILLICDITEQENLKAVSWVENIPVVLFQSRFELHEHE